MENLHSKIIITRRMDIRMKGYSFFFVPFILKQQAIEKVKINSFYLNFLFSKNISLRYAFGWGEMGYFSTLAGYSWYPNSANKVIVWCPFKKWFIFPILNHCPSLKGFPKTEMSGYYMYVDRNKNLISHEGTTVLAKGWSVCSSSRSICYF